MILLGRRGTRQLGPQRSTMSLRWSKRESHLSCSPGARWYVCDSNTEIVGCCMRNPCSEGCLDDDIRPFASRIDQHEIQRRNPLRDRAPESIVTNTSPSSRQNASPTTLLIIAATRSDSAVTTPSIVASTLGVVANTPSTTVNTPDIVADIPSIATDTPTILPTAPSIVADTPTVLPTAPSILAATSIIATDTSNTIATSSLSSATGASNSRLSNISSPSASANATTNAFPRSRIALIAGASGGGFVFALLVAVILFFWLHTRRSRQQHQRTFDRRMSEPDMIQKQLMRHPIAARGKTPLPLSASDADASPGSLHRMTLQHASPRTPSRSARSLNEPPTPSCYFERPSDSPSSSLSSSPSSANSWPLRTISQSHSYSNSTTGLASADIDLHPYRHYSAEHFHLPESPAGPLNAWKTSQPPDGPHVRPEDLWRKSIGVFELETPISPEAHDAATSRKLSIMSRPSTSRYSSFEPGETDSRTSSVGSELGNVHPDVPAAPPPVLVGTTGPRTWNTHRKSSSSGIQCAQVQ